MGHQTICHREVVQPGFSRPGNNLSEHNSLVEHCSFTDENILIIFNIWQIGWSFTNWKLVTVKNIV